MACALKLRNDPRAEIDRRVREAAAILPASQSSTVGRRRQLGATMIYVTHDLVTRLPPHRLPQVDEVVRLRFDRGRRHSFDAATGAALPALTPPVTQQFRPRPVRLDSGMNVHFDVVVVGSGPGGAGVARELARRGRRVLILERGRDWRRHPLYGTYAGALIYADRRALLFTREGLNIIRPLMVGGATAMYAGCSAPPPAWLRERYHVDVEADAAAIADELQVQPLPGSLRGEASTRVAEAARTLGLDWRPQDKFMLPARARPFDCAARCMLGCRCGAKWSAAEFVDDAIAAGATLWTGARVLRIDTEGGVARGVTGRRRGRPFTVTADRVIIAAGGLGTPLLLRTAGIDAGHGIAMDTTVMIYGSGPGRGMGEDPPMTWSAEDQELDVMYSTLIDPWLMYPIIMAVKGPGWPLTWPRWGRTLGVMIKLRDELSGDISPHGRVSKGLTAQDHARLDRAEVVARRILLQAGCEVGSLIRTPLRGTHPSATARIGDVVDADLRTGIDNLFVCDASVFPEALGRPTVLTILALARRLAHSLDATA